MDDAAQELGARVRVLVEPGRAVRTSVRNLSSWGAPEAAEARRAIERAVTRAGSDPAVEVRITLSENLTGPVWVAETDGKVVIVRAPEPARRTGEIAVEKKLLWRQEGPVLDAALLEGGVWLVLEPDRIRRLDGPATPLPHGGLRSRDPRGRLTVEGQRWKGYLPGWVCEGETSLGESPQCHVEDAAWPLGGGFEARLASGRNYFADGIVATAVVGDRRLAAGLDGRVRVAGGGEVAGMSDIEDLAGLCGARLLASRGRELQIYELTGGEATPAGEVLSMPGPVTALWPLAEPGSALAVAKDEKTGGYAAYRVAVDCGR